MEIEYTSQYEQFELRHWWFVSRRGILHDVLDRFIREPQHTRWLDIGCGTGVLLDSYKSISNKVGVEMDGPSVERARQKGLDVRQTSQAWDFDSLGQFDLVTLCDVLEHVLDHEAAVTEVHRRLRSGGTAIVTVPALRGLWGDHDIVNHHVRRYHRGQLLRLFTDGRWDVLKSSYFCSLLLPPIWLVRKSRNLQRRLGRHTAVQPAHDLRFGPPMIDRVLQSIFALERHWLRVGRFPAGSSLLVVLRKR